MMIHCVTGLAAIHEIHGLVNDHCQNSLRLFEYHYMIPAAKVKKNRIPYLRKVASASGLLTENQSWMQVFNFVRSKKPWQCHGRNLIFQILSQLFLCPVQCPANGAFMDSTFLGDLGDGLLLKIIGDQCFSL